MKLLALLLLIAISGCAPLITAHLNFDATFSEAIGTYSAPVMGGSPRPSGCQTQPCLAFDIAERIGYDAVRSGRATYVKLVDVLWDQRSKLWPNSSDGQPVHEYRAFLRNLAEQVDAGKLPSSQWEYLVERKLGETLERQRGQVVQCNTKNVGSPLIPNYQTVCRN